MELTFFLLLIQLAGLSWNLTYTAEEWNCDQGQITVVLHEQSLPVTLFDIELTETGKTRACEILNQAASVTFEIDDHVAQTTPLPVWLFADGELVQRLLVEEGAASVSISNPDYTYAAQLKAASSKPVIARSAVSSVVEYNRRRGEVGLAFLCFATSGFLIVWMLSASRRRRRSERNS